MEYTLLIIDEYKREEYKNKRYKEIVLEDNFIFKKIRISTVKRILNPITILLLSIAVVFAIIGSIFNIRNLSFLLIFITAYVLAILGMQGIKALDKLHEQKNYTEYIKLEDLKLDDLKKVLQRHNLYDYNKIDKLIQEYDILIKYKLNMRISQRIIELFKLSIVPISAAFLGAILVNVDLNLLKFIMYIVFLIFIVVPGALLMIQYIDEKHEISLFYKMKNIRNMLFDLLLRDF